MKTLILITMLAMSSIAVADHPAEVGPEALFYDYAYNHNMGVSKMDVRKDKGIVYVRDNIKRDTSLDNDHEDIVPSALLY